MADNDAMGSSELPESLIQLIRYCLPNFTAAELLVFLALRAESEWRIDALVDALRPGAFTPTTVEETLVTLRDRGLVQEHDGASFAYHPSSRELSQAVSLLISAFNERPVTLIREIYSQASNPLQSFADSFRFRDDAPQ